MDEPFFSIPADNLFIPARPIRPLDGFKFTENYPDCCPFHSSMVEGIKKWYERFPDCCDRHRDLLKFEDFDKAVFDYVPERVWTAHAYTEHAIEVAINDPDWFGIITDYIEYIEWQFGHPAIGADQYGNYLLDWLRTEDVQKQYDAEKIKKIIAHLVPDPTAKPTEAIDPAELFRVYKKWLNTFPFSISPFHQVREKMERTMPFLKGKMKTNRFTGMSRAQMVTPDELLYSLFERTKALLKMVNTGELKKGWQLPDFERQQVAVISETHRIGQQRLLDEYSKGEMIYVQILWRWLRNEDRYFRDIAKYFRPQSAAAAPSQLSELFVSDADYQAAIKALQEVTNPVIDSQMNYLLGQRQKGAVVGWIEVLKIRGKLNASASRSLLTKLINTAIHSLNISERAFSEVNTTAASLYRKRFLAIIK